MPAVADLVAGAEAVDSAAVVAAVHFAEAVEAVHFEEAAEAVDFAEVVAEAVRFEEVEASGASEAAEPFVEAAVDFAEDTAAMAAGTVTDAPTATDSSLALATPPGIGPVMPTILTIMDIPPIMVLRITTDTIRTLTVDMAHTDHMRLIRLRLL